MILIFWNICQLTFFSILISHFMTKNILLLPIKTSLSLMIIKDNLIQEILLLRLFVFSFTRKNHLHHALFTFF